MNYPDKTSTQHFLSNPDNFKIIRALRKLYFKQHKNLGKTGIFTQYLFLTKLIMVFFSTLKETTVDTRHFYLCFILSTYIHDKNYYLNL